MKRARASVCRRCGYHRSVHTYDTTEGGSIVLLCPVIGPSLQFQAPAMFERIPRPVHAPDVRPGWVPEVES